jgi:hypothetical protein
MLKCALKLLVSASMVLGSTWAAENPFIGEWKLNPSMSRMPDEMKVESNGDNTYTFDFGAGAETIVTDGAGHPGLGGTMLSVKVVGRDTWIVERRKDGRLLIQANWKLSKDGRTLTDLYRQFESDGSTFSVDYLYQRSGGGSGFAADWQSIKETMNSTLLLQVKEYQSDGLSFITPSLHQTKNVKLDGKDHPNEESASSTSVRRVDERTLEMTNKSEGQVTETREIRVSPDGKRLTMTVHPAGRDHPRVMVFDRVAGRETH